MDKSYFAKRLFNAFGELQKAMTQARQAGLELGELDHDYGDEAMLAAKIAGYDYIDPREVLAAIDAKENEAE